MRISCEETFGVLRMTIAFAVLLSGYYLEERRSNGIKRSRMCDTDLRKGTTGKAAESGIASAGSGLVI